MWNDRWMQMRKHIHTYRYIYIYINTNKYVHARRWSRACTQNHMQLCACTLLVKKKTECHLPMTARVCVQGVLLVGMEQSSVPTGTEIETGIK